MEEVIGCDTANVNASEPTTVNCSKFVDLWLLDQKNVGRLDVKKERPFFIIYASGITPVVIVWVFFSPICCSNNCLDILISNLPAL